MSDQDEDQKNGLMDFLTGLPQSPRGTVEAPQPETPASPALAPTDSGSAEETATDESNDARIKDALPGHSPQDLANVTPVSSAGPEPTGQGSQYGPEQEKALFQQIMAQRGGWQNRTARGAAGLGDAIMGVAGKQSPGFLNSMEKREDNNDKMATELIPALQKSQQYARTVGQQKDSDDPNSSASQAGRKIAENVFGKPMPPTMSLTQLDKLMPGLELTVKKQEAQLKVKELNTQAQRADTAQAQMTGALQHQTAEEAQARAALENTTKNDAAMRAQSAAALAETERANKVKEDEAARAKPLEAAKELQGRPWYQKAIEAVPSFGLTTSDSTKKLREELNRTPAAPGGSFAAPEVGQTVVHPSGAKVTRHK
jgi:hypothetical protein